MHWKHTKGALRDILRTFSAFSCKSNILIRHSFTNKRSKKNKIITEKHKSPLTSVILQWAQVSLCTRIAIYSGVRAEISPGVHWYIPWIQLSGKAAASADYKTRLESFFRLPRLTIPRPVTIHIYIHIYIYKYATCFAPFSMQCAECAEISRSAFGKHI